jgi:hypothetical protein
MSDFHDRLHSATFDEAVSELRRRLRGREVTDDVFDREVRAMSKEVPGFYRALEAGSEREAKRLGTDDPRGVIRTLVGDGRSDEDHVGIHTTRIF